MSTSLSPQAHAVVVASLLASRFYPAIAAALRAAADQVVPDGGDRWRSDLRGDAWIRWEERKLTRRELLAIAAELEAGG
jgi:hypothetical protein